MNELLPLRLGIAGLGYWGTRRDRKRSYTLTESIRAQARGEKVLLFNAGLDIGYMAAGLYLSERSRSETDPDRADRFLGWGQSLVLQGGFLFAYDVLFAVLQSRHANRTIYPWLERIQPAGLGLSYTIPLDGPRQRFRR